MYFTCVNVLPVCMYVCHVIMQSKRRCWVPWNCSYKWSWATMWVQRMKLRSSTKTTSLSLWPPQMNLHLVILHSCGPQFWGTRGVNTASYLLFNLWCSHSPPPPPRNFLLRSRHSTRAGVGGGSSLSWKQLFDPELPAYFSSIRHWWPRPSESQFPCLQKVTGVTYSLSILVISTKQEQWYNEAPDQVLWMNFIYSQQQECSDTLLMINDYDVGLITCLESHSEAPNLNPGLSSSA